jgi:hypothetical protein
VTLHGHPVLDVPGFALRPGSPAVLHLEGPREKLWGLLIEILPAGIVVRGLDLVVFDDWVRQEARGEEAMLGPTTAFYPMSRVVRIDLDETVGPVSSLSDRFARETGRTVWQAMGLDAGAPGER